MKAFLPLAAAICTFVLHTLPQGVVTDFINAHRHLAKADSEEFWKDRLLPDSSDDDLRYELLVIGEEAIAETALNDFLQAIESDGFDLLLRARDRAEGLDLYVKMKQDKVTRVFMRGLDRGEMAFVQLSGSWTPAELLERYKPD
ncbi:MAG: DUF4252 domain-containing protein [Saprospiraceae bacterium]|nr:DUF4252 domain-containing protein [Saprospiraceae bacterium]